MSRRHPHRRALAVGVATLLTGVVVARVEADGTITAIDAPAQATDVAARGAMEQVEQPTTPPDHSGCLKGPGTKVAASIDPAQRWYVDVQSTEWNAWKIAFYPRPGTRGAVALVGDSLTVAAMDETMAELIDAGFGPVCIDGQVARRVSVYTASTPSGVQEIARIKATDAVWRLATVRWVLALGTNDARANISSYSATIQKGRDAVGAVTVPLYWIDVRTRLGTPYTNYEDQWNSRLAAAGTVVIGWAAAVAPSPALYINNTDLIHLTSAGEDLRAQITRVALAAT